MLKSLSGFRLWVLSLILGTAAASLAFAYLDLPIAKFLHPHFWRFERLGLGSSIILSLEAVTALALIGLRILRGHLSRFGEALALACLSSICAYAINAFVLKMACGVPEPSDALLGFPHAFNLWQGSPNSSFPSGHMVIAGTVAGVFLRLYRTHVAAVSGALAVIGALLILGGWHFLSDVIAGGFLGVSAGLLAGEVWLAHLKNGTNIDSFRHGRP